MRRIFFLILATLCGALTVSTEGALADGGNVIDVPVNSMAGWEEVDAGELAAMLGTDSLTAAAQEFTVALESARNDRFVATETQYEAPFTGGLRARSGAVGGWETFVLIWDEATDTYAIRSQANGQYVAVERNYTGEAQNLLRARSSSIGSWERFSLLYSDTTEMWALRSELTGLYVAMEDNYTGSLQYALRARSLGVGGSWEQFYLYSLAV